MEKARALRDNLPEIWTISGMLNCCEMRKAGSVASKKKAQKENFTEIQTISDPNRLKTVYLA